MYNLGSYSQYSTVSLLDIHHYNMTERINFHCKATISLIYPQAAQTLFVIYIRDSIALRFELLKLMYENGSKIALNSTCSKGFI